MKVSQNETARPFVRYNANDCLTFSIHELVRIGIPKTFPYSKGIVKELTSFQTESSGAWDLFIDETPLEASLPLDPLEQTPSLVHLKEIGVHITFSEGRIFLACRRDPLPYFLPLLQWLLLQKGCSFVHAAAIALDGQGVLLPAAGGVGKTAAIRELCNCEGSSFLGDDLVILSEKGKLFSFPKPLFLYPYHRELFPHVFQSKRKLVVPTWLSKWVASIRKAVRPFLMNFPRLEEFARRYTPEHLHTPARDALPGVHFSANNPLSITMFLERYSGEEVSLEKIELYREPSIMVATLFVEMGGSAQSVLQACATKGLIPLPEFFGRMESILQQAMSSCPTYRLRIPMSFAAPQTGSIVAKSVRSVTEHFARNS